jgi:hypothetical protein
MIELTRMSKCDRLIFSAEPFRDGCEPLIGYIKVGRRQIVIIVDDRGLALIPKSDEGYETRLPSFSCDVLNILYQFKNQMTLEAVQEILSNYCASLEF